MSEGKSTFKRISNDDVYNELQNLRTDLVRTHQELGDKITELMNNNQKEHFAITQRQDRTNGKIKLGMWVATTALSVALILMGFLFSHLAG